MEDARFERLYAEHAQRLFAFLAYRTGDRALAEDLVSDTFERVLRSRRRYDPRRGSERTWLYAIALNVLRDDRRREAAGARSRERVIAAAAPAPAFEDLAETRDELARALAELSAEERETVALRFGADLTLAEIARVLGVPRTTVEGRLYRALRRLRELMG